ncbi:TPA: phage tail protein I [Salmonella enterica]|nr:phage tail protein I [Salmonella enterica]
MNNSLLPPSASGFMRRTEQASTRPDAIPVDLRKLWNPDECPVALLPYLAWALSVDRWDKEWPEEIKRAVIRNAYFTHHHKGTTGAIRRAVAPFGYLIRVTEWWETGDPPGAFRLDIGVNESGITGEMYSEMERLIDDARPVSRHLAGLNIIQDIPGYLYTGGVACDGDIITVYPEEVRSHEHEI